MQYSHSEYHTSQSLACKHICSKWHDILTYALWIWLFIFSNFQTTFVKHLMKNLTGFKIYFESTHIKFYRFINIYDLKFLNNEQSPLWIFFKFARKSVVLVILMEMKVSQVGCFQITGHWICYSIFCDISFIVFFTRLLSKCLLKNYPFSAQISKIHFKI